MTQDTTAYPYDTVVYVTDTIGDQEYQASGVLISPDEVLTASHVVYDAQAGLASDITVTPGYNGGGAPFGSAAGGTFHYFPVDDANDSISPEQSQSDYAVIHLTTSFPSLGTMGLEAGFAGGLVNVTGYPAAFAGQQVTGQQTMTVDPNYTLLDGLTIGEGSSGGPVWVESGGSAEVVGLVSSGVGGPGSLGYFTQITPAAYAQISAWVAEDDAPTSAAPVIAVEDTTSGMALPAAVEPYTGPVAGLQDEYVNITPDSLNITAGSPNWFIHGGSGNDAIAASSGTNVLDGGTGSNFLTGGSGTDTFFVDDRGPAADIWDTVASFHAGDAATVWGVTPSQFSLVWADNQGAAGYTGLTLHATAAGSATASITLAGFSQADLSNGRLSVSYGTDPGSGSNYLYIHENT